MLQKGEEMAELNIRIKDSCLHKVVGEKDCWHGPCRVRRRFKNGLLLIENEAGFVRVVSEDELEEAEGGKDNCVGQVHPGPVDQAAP